MTPSSPKLHCSSSASHKSYDSVDPSSQPLLSDSKKQQLARKRPRLDADFILEELSRRHSPFQQLPCDNRAKDGNGIKGDVEEEEEGRMVSINAESFDAWFHSNHRLDIDRRLVEGGTKEGKGETAEALRGAAAALLERLGQRRRRQTRPQENDRGAENGTTNETQFIGEARESKDPGESVDLRASVRLVLLLCRPREDEDNKNKGEEASIPPSNMTLPIPLDRSESARIAQSVLMAWTLSLRNSLLERQHRRDVLTRDGRSVVYEKLADAAAAVAAGDDDCNDDDDDDDDEAKSNETLAVILAIRALLRDIDPIVPFASALLAPTWRGICDLASAFFSLLPCADSSGGDLNPRGMGSGPTAARHGMLQFLFSDLLREAVMRLAEYLKEGEASISRALRQTRSSAQPHGGGGSRAAELKHGTKVLIFLLARLGTLVPLLINDRFVDSTREAKWKDKRVWKPQFQGVLCKIMAISCRLRGLASEKLDLCGGDEIDEVLRKLSGKVEGFVSKVTMPRSGLCALLQVPILAVDAATPLLDGHDDQNGGKFCQAGLKSVRKGKLFLILRLLSSRPPPASAAVDGRDGGDMDPNSHEDGGDDDGGFDWDLETCESLLFEVLPSCHAYLCVGATRKSNSAGSCDRVSGDGGGGGPGAARILAETAAAVASALARRDAVGLKVRGGQRRARNHYALARWLNPAIFSADAAGANCEVFGGVGGLHPLTREALLMATHLHAFHLARLSSFRTPLPSVASRSSLRVLVSILWGLAIDPRTGGHGRANCAAALVRILRVDGKPAGAETANAAEVEVAAVAALVMRDDLSRRGLFRRDDGGGGSGRRRRRRRRRRQTIGGVSSRWDALLDVIRGLHPRDVGVVAALIEAAAAHGCFWSASDGGDASVTAAAAAASLMGEIKNVCSQFERFDWSERRRGSLPMCSIPIALSFICGCLSDTEITSDFEIVFRNRIGASVELITGSIIQGIVHLAKWNENFRHDDNQQRQVLLTLIRSLLIVVTRTPSVAKASDILAVLDCLAELVKLLLGREGRGEAPTSLDGALLLEIAAFLHLGGNIPVEWWSQDVLLALSQIFRELLGCGKWLLQTTSVSSFLAFASALPVRHQSVLSRCLPAATQPLLQCRLKGMAYDWGLTKTDVDGAGKDHDQAAEESEALLPLCQGGGAGLILRRQYAPALDHILRAGSVLYAKGGNGPVLILPPGMEGPARDALVSAFSSATLGSVVHRGGYTDQLVARTVARATVTRDGTVCRLRLEDV